MSRLFIIAALLGVTIGLPYVLDRLSSKSPSSAVAPPPTAGTGLSAPILGSPTELSPTQTPNSLTSASSVPLEGTRFHSVEQVLRFDITKEWVYQNWSRKSTGPTDVGLFAVRVAAVTGTHLSAIAGSLTYFFNAYGQVEHISFRGRTGDTTHLVNFLTRTYGFQPAAAPVGEQLLQVKRGERVQSELRTRSESVVSTASPHTSIAVELELARPGSARFLPPRVPQLEIPQVSSTQAATTPAGEAASSEGTSSGSSALDPYLEKFRYATPQEEGQVLWRRWPN
jgi:hypothetical protein